VLAYPDKRGKSLEIFKKYLLINAPELVASLLIYKQLHVMVNCYPVQKGKMLQLISLDCKQAAATGSI